MSENIIEKRERRGRKKESKRKIDEKMRGTERQIERMRERLSD